MDFVGVVDALRTPVAPQHGALSAWHPADLAGRVLTALAERTGLDPESVDEVVMGCDTPVGAQAGDLAAAATDSAGWPESVPTTMTGRPIVSALRAVLAGTSDIVIAAGVDCASTVPPGAATVRDYGRPRTVATTPAGAAEAVAATYGLTRDDLDAYALSSVERALAADSAAETVVVGPGAQPSAVSGADLAALDPLFDTSGVITAGNMAQPADAAAAALIVSARAVEQHGFEARAVVGGVAVAGGPPTHVPLVRAAAASGTGGLVRVEIEERFAALVLAWLADTGVDRALVNPNGGALALGDAGGAEPLRMLATLSHGLNGPALHLAQGAAVWLAPPIA